MTVTVPAMQLTNINGVDLDLFDSGGSGEPVVFIHGGMRDGCAAEHLADFFTRHPIAEERSR